VYLQALRMTSSLNFPIYALLALFPGQIVALLLGAQWNDASFYLRLFALWGLIRSTGNPSGSLVYARGLARRAHLWNLAQLIVTVPLLWIAMTAGGLPALASTMLALQCAIYVLAWAILVRPACSAGFLEYGACVTPPLLASALACGMAFLATWRLAGPWVLPVGATVFAISYLLFSWRLNRIWLRAVLELLEPLRKHLAQAG
jgi:O-antigen/teichoic acid export membrane protein